MPQTARKRQDLVKGIADAFMDRWGDDATFGQFLQSLSPQQRRCLEAMPLHSVLTLPDRCELTLLLPQRGRVRNAGRRRDWHHAAA